MTIDIPETLDRESIKWPTNSLTYQGVKNAKGAEGTSQVGDKAKAPSGGGQGEGLPQQIIKKNKNKFEISITKAVHAGNQIFGGLINSYKKSDDLKWEAKFEDALTGKSQLDLVSEEVIDRSYNVIAEILEKSDWLELVATDISKQANSNFSEIQKRKREEELLRKSEVEFISGTRDDIILSQSELEIVNTPHIERDFNLDIKKSILEKLIPTILLVSKNEVLGYKFDLDTTQFQDHNTIKVAKQVAEKVYQLLPPIVEESYLEVMKILGE
jgi:hypothetical protein